MDCKLRLYWDNSLYWYSSLYSVCRMVDVTKGGI